MLDVPDLLHAASRLGIQCGGGRRTRWTTRASAAGSAASTRPRRTTTPAAMVGPLHFPCYVCDSLTSPLEMEYRLLSDVWDGSYLTG